MPQNTSDWDPTVVLFLLVAFGLPITLLIPNFSVWNIIPKIRVVRYHVISYFVTWSQLNAIIVSMLVLFFCLYLEIRKRKLDFMLEKVLTVSQVTDSTMEEEREHQAAAMRVCVEMLDVSSEHYEHLILLRDELRKREKPKVNRPPEIDGSSM